MEETREKMEQIFKHLREELANLRTGRPNPAMLDPVLVDAYGTQMRIKDLATVTASEGRQLIITPFDPQMAGAIAKGIEKANLGVSPNSEGILIRIPIPPMTEEIRKKIAKEAKDKAEKAKIAIRNCRRDANDGLKKQKAAGDLTEDEQKRGEKQIQEFTDRFCKQIDQLYTEKEKEILSV
jgi:ribosome recycling factor